MDEPFLELSKGMDLYQRSIEVVLQNQAPSGAYIASPAFPVYQYSWLRDGSFCAYAMDRVGQHDSARAYFRWVAAIIQRYARKVDRALVRVGQGVPLGKDDYLHTRYTVDGFEVNGHWWDFQLDGYGTWLWALAEHVKSTAVTTLAPELAESISLTVQYLIHLWQLPNYDCWEERGDYLHPYTLASVYAGLQAAAELLPALAPEAQETAVAIRRFVLEFGVCNGRFVKSFTTGKTMQKTLSEQQSVFHDDKSANALTSMAEASLVGVATPYTLLASDHPIMQATITHVEKELHRLDGGVYRYREDSFYGGGEWIVLSGWLGWHYARHGNVPQAKQLLYWIESQADANGYLPEQVATHLLAPQRLTEWEARWGANANPLTWSHAMYLILFESLKEES